MGRGMRQVLSTPVALPWRWLSEARRSPSRSGPGNSTPRNRCTPRAGTRESTLVYEAAGAGIKVTVDQVPATGPAVHYTFTAYFDGKDVPLVGTHSAIRRAYSGESHDDEDGQQEGWTTSVHLYDCHLRRWQDAHRHHRRHGCRRASIDSRCGL